MHPLRFVPTDVSPATTSESSLEAELAEAHVKIRNLEVALTTARVISAAVGILMATYKITSESAFEMLVVASQHTHQKLRDLAERVVETGTLDVQFSSEPPPRTSA